MNLRKRFRLVLAGAGVGMLALTFAWAFNERAQLLAERKSKAMALVEAADSILTQYGDKEVKGSLSQAEAQNQALEILRRMRYDQNNYFWVHDMDVIMVMDPVRPELEGKDLLNFRDPGGNTFFIEMTKLVQSRDFGFVSYQSLKPGGTETVDKISFVKGFKPWGWVLGSAIYVDDIETTWHRHLLDGGLLTLVSISILFVVSETASRSTFQRLSILVARFKDVAKYGPDTTLLLDVRPEGNLATDVPDEIDEAILAFNEMLLQSSKREQTSAHHQGNGKKKRHAQGLG